MKKDDDKILYLDTAPIPTAEEIASNFIKSGNIEQALLYDWTPTDEHSLEERHLRFRKMQAQDIVRRRFQQFQWDFVEKEQVKEKQKREREKQQVSLTFDGSYVLDELDRVEGILPLEGVSGIVADRKAGKSSFLNALSMHIISGKDFFGRYVEQCKVVHVHSEGGKKRNRNRVQKAADLYEIPLEVLNKNYRALVVSFNLTEPDAYDKVYSLLKDEGFHNAGVVIIDTLTKNMRGAQNEQEVMEAAMQNMIALARRMDACIVNSHHFGKDKSKGARGSLTYEDSLDSMVKITKHPTTGVITTSVELNREGESGEIGKGKIKGIFLGLSKKRKRPVYTPVFLTADKLEDEERELAEKLDPNDDPKTKADLIKLILKTHHPRGFSASEFLEHSEHELFWDGHKDKDSASGPLRSALARLVKNGELIKEDGRYYLTTSREEKSQ